MRKLLMLCLAAVLAHVISAQSPTRANAQPATSSKTQTLKPRPGSLAPTSLDRPATSTKSNSAATPRQETAPSTSRTTAKSVDRSASPAAKPTTTAKTVPALMPAAPALQTNEPMVQVEWMSLEDALEKSKTEKRKIFIDVFTDWCGWCKRMDESTFVDPEVAKYLNDNYYPVKLNAEQQADINFNNKTYHFHKNGARGYHELAAELLNNRLSFPTVVFLDETMNVIQPIPGYLEAPKMEAILNYFGTDSHKTTPWETYEKKFNNNQQR